MDGSKADSATHTWIALPEPLKAKLRLGFTGKRHLLDIAGWCLNSDNSALSPIAADALETAIRENPLDGAMALDLLALEPVRELLTQDTLRHLLTLTRHWRLPDTLDEYRNIQRGRNFSELKKYISTKASAEPLNLFWKEQAIFAGCMDGDTSYSVESTQADITKDTEPIIIAAKRRLEELFLPNERSEADWQRFLKTPWNTTEILQAHDLVRNVAQRKDTLTGSVAILVYSWNKADELDATLASLAESDLTGASLFVLDNGSTDHTAPTLQQHTTRFESLLGADRFNTISLPVNIGAAAARNWLLHTKAVQEHEFICYLDDDVELPADWLSRLGTAVSEYPDAGVWGCKVVDHTNPLLIQSADSHLLIDPNQPFDLSKVAPNPFKLSDLHIQVLDSGAFDFMRPCASVTGCCHLFRTQTLLETGDFAIQLSPSQYDDMEHDLRLCEAGLFPVYQGHLTVRHKKRTGAASRTNMQEEGNAIGNKYKMQTMHTPAEIGAAKDAEQKLLDEDYLRKLAYLDKA